MLSSYQYYVIMPALDTYTTPLSLVLQSPLSSLINGSLEATIIWGTPVNWLDPSGYCSKKVPMLDFPLPENLAKFALRAQLF